MIINGKRVLEWTETDLLSLVGNTDYKESDAIDYKVTFAFFEIEDKMKSQQKKDEFRHDICSFANANGGYLFFGIDEEKGIPTEVLGLKISEHDTDTFERKLKDIISTIKPIVPSWFTHFIQLSNNDFVVIIKIEKGIYKPYVNKENDWFKYYMRRGNGKVCLNYEEVKSMYNKGMEISNQIDEFRKKRIKMCIDKEGVASTLIVDSFALIHFIPDMAFINKNYINPFAAFMNGDLKYKQIFYTNAYGDSAPNVDGLAFCDSVYSRQESKYLQFFKSGIVEKYAIIHKNKGRVNDPMLYIEIKQLCNDIEILFREAINYYKVLNHRGALFFSVSVVNCKGCCSESGSCTNHMGIIDRNEIDCMPFEIYDIYNEKQVEMVLKSALFDLCYSTGRKSVKDIFD